MIDKNGLEDIPIEVDYNLVRTFMSGKDLRRLKRIVSDYNAVKKISTHDFIFLVETVKLLEVMQRNEDTIAFYRRHKKSMKVAAALGMAICLFLIAMIVIVLFGSIPEGVLLVANILFPTIVLIFMIWSKEAVIKDNFKNLPWHLKIIWWGAFLFNGYNLVKNVFMLVN